MAGDNGNGDKDEDYYHVMAEVIIILTMTLSPYYHNYAHHHSHQYCHHYHYHHTHHCHHHHHCHCRQPCESKHAALFPPVSLFLSLPRWWRYRHPSPSPWGHGSKACSTPWGCRCIATCFPQSPSDPAPVLLPDASVFRLCPSTNHASSTAAEAWRRVGRFHIGLRVSHWSLPPSLSWHLAKQDSVHHKILPLVSRLLYERKAGVDLGLVPRSPINLILEWSGHFSGSLFLNMRQVLYSYACIAMLSVCLSVWQSHQQSYFFFML